MLSQLYATNYLPSCIVRVYDIVMMQERMILNDVNRFMCRARLFTECPREFLDYSESFVSKLFLNL